MPRRSAVVSDGGAAEYAALAWNKLARLLAPVDTHRASLVRSVGLGIVDPVERAHAAQDALSTLRLFGPSDAADHFREVRGLAQHEIGEAFRTLAGLVHVDAVCDELRALEARRHPPTPAEPPRRPRRRRHR